MSVVVWIPENAVLLQNNAFEEKEHKSIICF